MTGGFGYRMWVSAFLVHATWGIRRRRRPKWTSRIIFGLTIVFDFGGFRLTMQELQDHAELRWRRLCEVTNAWRLRELHEACFEWVRANHHDKQVASGIRQHQFPFLTTETVHNMNGFMADLPSHAPYLEPTPNPYRTQAQVSSKQGPGAISSGVFILTCPFQALRRQGPYPFCKWIPSPL